MSLENMNKHAGTSEVDFDALDEVVKEMKYRQREDALVCELLTETEEEHERQKKLKEMKKYMSEAAKLIGKAEHLLADVIGGREEEDRKIEDTILLSDGTTIWRE